MAWSEKKLPGPGTFTTFITNAGRRFGVTPAEAASRLRSSRRRGGFARAGRKIKAKVKAVADRRRKLTVEQVQAVRDALGTQVQIAARFKISQSRVSTLRKEL